MLAVCLAALESDGDRALFLAYYQKYDRLAHYLAMRILGSQALAEEAVQEAWIRVCENFQKFLSIPCQNRRAWIVIVVENTAKNLLRREKRLSTLAFDPVDRRADPDKSGDWLLAMICEMNPVDREILELRLVTGYSNREAAARLGITPDAAGQRYSRAMARLRELLREEGING